MSYRLLGTEWKGDFEMGRHGLTDYVWNAVNNAEGALSIHMASRARFFVNWRSGSSLSCSEAFDTFEDAVEHSSKAFAWLPLKPWVLLDPEGPHYFNFQT
jgi:hypothetical protein